MTIRGVLFDKDGTLIDFDATFGPATASVIHELAGVDAETADLLAQAALFDSETCSIDPSSFLLAGSLTDIATGWRPIMGRDTPLQDLIDAIDRAYQRHSLNSLTPFGWTEAMLGHLSQRGLKLGIATNDSEGGARTHMGKLGLLEQFDFVAGFDSGHGAKPGPGMVEAFASHIGAAPAEVVMVGDTPHDCQAGRAAGSLVIAVTSGRIGHDELAPLADHVLPDTSGLPGLFDQLNQ